MNIGILGTGDVGQRLGSGFLSIGHDVKMGSRDPKNEALAAWVAANGSHASGGTFADAAQFGEVVVLATAWSGTENVLRLAGPQNLAGKIVIDATNPLVVPSGATSLQLALGWNDSAGEQVQRWLPGAKVVKCFNIVGNEYMIHPEFPGGPPDMFIAGNDAGAKATVAGFLKEFGWPPAIDMGGIEGARLLEPLAMLWIQYGKRTGTWDHAFKLLRKS
ncbi:MAG TPA: NADPH-dependent F420 reductase [Candidatus Acidoferrales bacterium]|nr:NADPH-dependent F420 reductase [Candidatus Acidoferrales bacterium]